MTRKVTFRAEVKANQLSLWRDGHVDSVLNLRLSSTIEIEEFLTKVFQQAYDAGREEVISAVEDLMGALK